MTDNSPRLEMPFILPSQAQKHVTHNEALQKLDAIVQLAIKTAATAPPPTPAEGDCHWVLAPATGAWSAQTSKIASFQDGIWNFITPRTGWLAVFLDSGKLMQFDGTQWVKPGLPDEAQFLRLGVGATPDTTNRLSVASPASLFNHAGASHRMTINKALTSETASLLFQSNWQGRAEMGLTGDDSFSVKVMGNTTGWRRAIVISQEGYVRQEQKPIARASKTAGNATPAAGSFTGFDTLHLANGDFVLGATVAAGQGRFLTIPTSGHYLVSLTARTDATANHIVHVSRNSTSDIVTHAGGASGSSVSAVIWLDAGNSLSLRHETATLYQFGYGKTEINICLL